MVQVSRARLRVRAHLPGEAVRLRTALPSRRVRLDVPSEGARAQTMAGRAVAGIRQDAAHDLPRHLSISLVRRVLVEDLGKGEGEGEGEGEGDCEVSLVRPR